MKFEKKIKDLEQNIQKQKEVLKDYQDEFKTIFQQAKIREENKANEEGEEKIEQI